VIRTVNFTDDGDIVLRGELGTDFVKSGCVLLTKAQADEAAKHGWVIQGDPETATQPPLYRVYR
jgi:hypothetical protein